MIFHREGVFGRDKNELHSFEKDEITICTAHLFDKSLM